MTVKRENSKRRIKVISKLLDKDFKRLEHESEEDYIYRVCGLKDKKGLIWEEITEVLNKELDYTYSESRYRKLYTAYIRGYQSRNEEIEKMSPEELDEYTIKNIELQKQRVKIQTLRLDFNKNIREQARQDLMYEEVVRAIQQINWTKSYDFQPLQKQDEKAEYLLAFADVHFSKEFRSITNFYNEEEVYKRFHKLLEEIKELVKDHRIGVLHVCALGDLLEGFYLRVSQIRGTRLGLVDQLIEFQKFLMEWLDEVSKIVKIKYYSVLSSNHGQTRPYGSKLNEFVLEDMERVIFAFLKERFKDNDRIEIAVTEEKFSMLEVAGYNIILFHGHEIKNLATILKDISWKYKKFFDYALVAHNHVGGEIVCGEGANGKNNCSVIRVPSIMGTDPYADDLLLGSKAGASLIKFTRSQGKRFIEDLILN